MRVSKSLRLTIASGLLLIIGGCGGGSGSESEKPSGNNGKSSVASISSSSQATQQTLFSWSHPNSRANGEYLELDDIGGYEIRYQLPEGGDYIYLNLSALTIQLPLTGLPPEANFEIAVYDTQGLYSDFVPINPH